MSLELDFLAELVKQPNMESKTATIAKALGWPEEFPNQTYGIDLGNMVGRRLASKGIVKCWQDNPTGHLRVRLVRPLLE